MTATTLFTDTRIFDGVSDVLSGPAHVLVSDGVIERISPTPIETAAGRPVSRIDGTGKVLMPGLIDAHWHAVMAVPSQMVATTADVGYLHLLAGQEAGATVLRGFTSVRDLGGPTFGLKRAIDEGAITGPRIWPSGAFISQTGGHGDFRMPYEAPRSPGDPLSHSERVGIAAIADGADAVLLRAREQLRQGASQLKLMAGGGIASAYDPIDGAQYTEAEFRAAVDAAENWGTYVTVHAYTSRAIRMAVAGGVRCIDHGQLMDEDTARMLADQGIWLSLQPFLDDEDAVPAADPRSAQKHKIMTAGTDTAYELAKRFGIRTAFGTDTLFDAGLAARQGKQLAKLVRWYSPAEVLRMATSVNAELLAMSGPRNPYPGRLGVVAEGALADLILVDGDPIADIRLIADPARNFAAIMRAGQLVKGG